MRVLRFADDLAYALLAIFAVALIVPPVLLYRAVRYHAAWMFVLGITLIFLVPAFLAEG